MKNILNEIFSFKEQLDFFKKVITFATETIIKDQKTSDLYETDISNTNSSLFVSVMKRDPLVLESLKAKYVNLALFEGYEINVQEKNFELEEISHSELPTFSDSVFVYDNYSEIPSNEIPGNLFKYKRNLFRREIFGGYFTYLAIVKEEIQPNIKYFFRRSNDDNYKAVGKDEAIFYKKIYKIKKSSNIYDVNKETTGNNLFVEGPNPGEVKSLNIKIKDFLFYNETLQKVTNILEREEVLVKEDTYYYKDSLSCPIKNLVEINYYENIYEYNPDTLTFTLLDDYSLINFKTFDHFKYVFNTKYEVIDKSQINYYSSIYLYKDNKIIDLETFIVNKFKEEYISIFTPSYYHDNCVLTKVQTIYFDYDIENKIFYPHNSSLTVKHQKDLCLNCLSENIIYQYVDNYKKIECLDCGTSYFPSDYVDYKDIYLVFNGDELLFEMCTSESVVNMFQIFKNKQIQLVDFFMQNTENKYKEVNPYYIELAKLGVDLETARLAGDNQLIYVPNESELSITEKNMFQKFYYETLSYMTKNIMNPSFNLFQNNLGVFKLFTLINTCIRYTDFDWSQYDANFLSERELINLMNSHGIGTLDSLDPEYLRKVAKNINNYLRYRGTENVIDLTLNLFGIEDTIQVKRYYLIKDYKRNDQNQIDIEPIYTEEDFSNDTTKTLKAILSRRDKLFPGLSYDNLEKVDLINRISNKVLNDILVDYNNKGLNFNQLVQTIKEKYYIDFTYDEIEKLMIPFLQKEIKSLIEKSVDNWIRTLNTELDIKTEAAREYYENEKEIENKFSEVYIKEYIEKKILQPINANNDITDYFNLLQAEKSLYLNELNEIINGLDKNTFMNNTYLEETNCFNEVVRITLEKILMGKFLIVKDYDMLKMIKFLNELGIYYIQANSVRDLFKVYLEYIQTNLLPYSIYSIEIDENNNLILKLVAY
jgi:hypothetical protein